MRISIIIVASLSACFVAAAGCQGAEREDSGSDGDVDADTDADTDTDTGSDTGTDTGADSGNMCPGEVQSFIWIANTGESTLSKVCTTTGEEVARYRTCPHSSCDPSRTSVNLHGDMVVTNRDPSGPSSVTKFIAEFHECIDRNGNGIIDTSMGPDDVLDFGEDECMAWYTELTTGSSSIGARATAWDGLEDEDTGLGGHAYIGAMFNQTVYKLDGDTGEILASRPTGLGHYGGAVDGRGNFWTVAMGCTIGLCNIQRISLDDLADHETFPVHCGYGISVDAQGRIWTSGLGCVSRLDPATNPPTNDWVSVGGFNRGVAVDGEGSVWAANTAGDLVRVDEDTLELVWRGPVGPQSLVGVAVDFEGYVWAVSQGGNTAHKIDPQTYQVTDVPIGLEPYTYSDMTGMQLRNVVVIE